MVWNWHRPLDRGRPKATCCRGIGRRSRSLECAAFFALEENYSPSPPCEIEPHCWSQATPPDKFSFPSGHTITAFAITIALGTCYPAFQFPLLVVAASIGLSRIVLGMHYLSDVIAGAFLGSTLGLVFFYVFH
jgi:undecaprenyl-diphosphatase